MKTKSVTFTRIPGLPNENDWYVCEQSVDNFNFLAGNEYKERDIVPYTNKSGWKVVINRKKG